VSAEFPRINNRLVEPGTELSVKGEAGRFVFRWMTGDDLTCWGGKSGREKYRTFSVDKVRRVHNKQSLLSAKERKQLKREENEN
jgi:hypothetical protein